MLFFSSHINQENHQTAIIDRGTEFSYIQLSNRIDEIASTLLSESEDLKEERIALFLEPGFNFISAFLAIWKSGGIAVPLCIEHPIPSLDYVLEDTACQQVIATHEHSPFLNGLSSSAKIIDIEEMRSSTSFELPIREDRKALIVYTSGTTNKPKGVLSTHAIMKAQMDALIEAWEYTKDDHLLNVLPLHHVHGLVNCLLTVLRVGGLVEFIGKFKEEEIWKTFLGGKINVFMAVPTIYYKLIRHWVSNIEKQGDWSKSLKNFRLMVSGSSALPQSVMDQWKGISGHTLLERYGMTEMCMALSNPYRGERKTSHVGLPMPGLEVRLVEDAIRNELRGEIQVRGKNVFLSYWRNEEATMGAFTSDGWFKTGDIAELHDGYYKILGRSSVDIIKSGGYKISALEIEDVLLRHTLVEECAVVGLLDEEWGERIIAFVILSADCIDEELNAHCELELASYKLPKEYRRVESLPRNSLGKLTKNELKKDDY